MVTKNKIESFIQATKERAPEPAKVVAAYLVLSVESNPTEQRFKSICKELHVNTKLYWTMPDIYSSKVLEVATANLALLGYTQEALEIATEILIESRIASGHAYPVGLYTQIQVEPNLTIRQKVNELKMLREISNRVYGSELSIATNIHVLIDSITNDLETAEGHLAYAVQNQLMDDVAEEIFKRANTEDVNEHIHSHSLRKLGTEELAITYGMKCLLYRYVAKQDSEYQSHMEDVIAKIPLLHTYEDTNCKVTSTALVISEKELLHYYLDTGRVSGEHLASLYHLLAKIERGLK